MKARRKVKHDARPTINPDYFIPYVPSEQIAIKYLHKHGIPALPGKAIRHSFVDVIVFGCIGVEVKYAQLADERGVMKYTFATTPDQQKNGFRGDVVLLICDDGNEQTFHLFPADHDVFYMGDRLKTGFTFTPGAMRAKKHANSRTVMTAPMMDAAKDYVSIIDTVLSEVTARLQSGQLPKLLVRLSE